MLRHVQIRAFSVSECVCVCTDASVGGLSGRRGGWEEEEALDFGRRGFLGRRDGRVGLERSPSFTSSPTHKTNIHTKTIQHNEKNTQADQSWICMQRDKHDSNTCIIRQGEGKHGCLSKNEQILTFEEE